MNRGTSLVVRRISLPAIGCAILAVFAATISPAAAAQKKSGAPPASPSRIDQGYTEKIKQYTTEKFFLTELVDHLPASDSVPSPEKVLGYAIGTPNKLTYTGACSPRPSAPKRARTKDMYRYYREHDPRAQLGGCDQRPKKLALLVGNLFFARRGLGRGRSLRPRLNNVRVIQSPATGRAGGD